MAGRATTSGDAIGLAAIIGSSTQLAATTYLALCTADPGVGATVASLAELATPGYARQTVAWTAPAGQPASASNSALMTFGPFTSDPPTVTHAALVDVGSGTAGLVRHIWTLDQAKDAALGESLQVAIGQLVATLA